MINHFYGRTLLIPRHSIGEEKYLLDEVLEGASEKFGIGMEKR